ncbi:TIGR01459 family HAD-type hydrolase [Minwuia thermotolerans]|uniref:TIGR01459 family HAD-type hydrolase n=1 Tax=Minwuia thermotolerans TaxID=2056226 RepID=A0A2M9G2A9_9PROT|nr:TIGR01459 family HAD-type hydrolase [Minwuia thermotolerans]PJK29852.1 TIGR01459 family HAD-type hydrolase [Minwuia thermotolerans]
MTVDVIDHIAPLAERHDAFLFDLWGVVHNGIEAYPGALRTLAALTAQGKRVLLLSNAPRLGTVVDPFLARMGVPREHYDRVVASGDLVRAALESGAVDVGRRFLFWGKGPDRTITEGLDLEETDSLGDADFILCGGLNNDETETVDDYAGALAQAKNRGLPMVCANPDYEVMRGHEMLPCAGALAQAYQDIGGKVHWFGKPYGVAYDYCRHELGDIAPDRMLAVGDTLRTDIAGATAAGIAGVLVTGGIHAREVMAEGRLDEAALIRICAAADLWPVAAMTQLEW